MTIHELAGKPVPKELLVDIDKLRKEYYTGKPDITNSAERVSFGTSGHRGSSLRGGTDRCAGVRMDDLHRRLPKFPLTVQIHGLEPARF